MRILSPGGAPGNVSHPAYSLPDMSTLETSHVVTIDPFADPVAYLAEHGIEAELVEVVRSLPEAA